MMPLLVLPPWHARLCSARDPGPIHVFALVTSDERRGHLFTALEEHLTEALAS